MISRIRNTARRILRLQTYLQMQGNRKLYLENCRRILEYNDILIVVQTTDMILEIWGADLRTDSRTPDSLCIHGEIQSITFTPKGGGHGTASAR